MKRFIILLISPFTKRVSYVTGRNMIRIGCLEVETSPHLNEALECDKEEADWLHHYYTRTGVMHLHSVMVQEITNAMG